MNFHLAAVGVPGWLIKLDIRLGRTDRNLLAFSVMEEHLYQTNQQFPKGAV